MTKVKKTPLEISVYAQYYKKDITDRYMINNKSIVITNDAIDILDKPQEKLYIEPLAKKVEKDKEIERLNKIIEVKTNRIQELMKRLSKRQEKVDRLNNIINELEWKPIDEYFKNKENYDWVLVKYYDKYNFECIPSVAEWRFDKWYLKDNEKSLQDFEVKYFFDMQQLDRLKELKEGR